MKPKEYYHTIAKIRHQQEPWQRLLRTINYRCYNQKSKDYQWYNSHNIQNYLTISDIKFLMKRDNYYVLNNPTIDREDNDGHYCLENCRFIENEENAVKDKEKPILQFDLQGNFIREWRSQNEASRQLGISQGNISSCCVNIRFKASGFRWQFKLDTTA